MQLASRANTGRGDVVGFELAVFERTACGVRVTIRGMTRMVDVDLMGVTRPDGVRVSPVGSTRVGPLREFAACVELELADDDDIELRGRGSVESMAVADIPCDMPVVCGADPTAHALPSVFLHRRGDRLVQTSVVDVESAGRSIDRTMLVA